MNDDTQGEWTVTHSDDDTACVMHFTHVGMDGVESFITAMPYDHARQFAHAVLTICEENV